MFFPLLACLSFHLMTPHNENMIPDLLPHLSFTLFSSFVFAVKLVLQLFWVFPAFQVNRLTLPGGLWSLQCFGEEACRLNLKFDLMFSLLRCLLWPILEALWLG